MAFESKEWALLMDIQYGNKLGYYEELVAKSTKELQ